MHIQGQRNKIIGEINITPLTDIFLVLLIIMMLVAPLLNSSGLKLAVPSAAPAEDQKEEPKITKIKISAAGTYSIADKEVPKGSLSYEIKRLKDEHPDGVIIEADPEGTHETLTFAMDAVQSAGVSKLAVMNLQTGTEQPSQQ